MEGKKEHQEPVSPKIYELLLKLSKDLRNRFLYCTAPNGDLRNRFLALSEIYYYVRARRSPKSVLYTVCTTYEWR